jgi:ribonuclease HI
LRKRAKQKNPVLMKYLEKVREMERHFKCYSVQHILREDNNEADKLAKAAARNQAMPPDVFFEIIKEPSIKEKGENHKCCGNSQLESRNHGLPERPL